MKKYPKVRKYKVQNKDKYIGNLHECEHRSSWELIYMKYLDGKSDVLEWGSEIIVVPYYHPIDKRSRRYYVDFYVKVMTKTGMTKKYIIEIKPYNQCFPPKKPKRQTNSYKNKIKTYLINQAKWKAAKKYADKRDWEFVVITEKELGIR